MLRLHYVQNAGAVWNTGLTLRQLCMVPLLLVGKVLYALFRSVVKVVDAVPDIKPAKLSVF
jgi:hypothetical protein